MWDRRDHELSRKRVEARLAGRLSASVRSQEEGVDLLLVRGVVTVAHDLSAVIDGGGIQKEPARVRRDEVLEAPPAVVTVPDGGEGNVLDLSQERDAAQV